MGFPQARTLFQVVDDVAANIDPIELVDVINASGTEDVNFEQFVTDNICAHEVEAIGNEFGLDRFGNLRFHFGEFGAFARSADVDVAAHFALGGHASVYRSLPVDDDRLAVQKE